MVEFTLPRNSVVKKGKLYKADGATNIRLFQVYRWDPTRAKIRGSTATKSIWTSAGRWCWMRF